MRRKQTMGGGPPGRGQRDKVRHREEYVGARKEVNMPVRIPQPDKYGAFSDLVGLNITRGEYGYCECTVEISEKLLNPVMVVHGGVISTMVDFGMAAALFTTFDEGELPATVEIKVSYLASATSGVLICESRLIHRAGRIAFAESEIKNDGRLVAKGTGTYRVYRSRKTAVT
jgi:uncharacterized protein (TIGR00369 family)